MTRRVRRGAALAMALFALVMMAAVADAILAPAVASRRAAWRLAAHHAAESEAERALASIAGRWSTADWRAMAVGAESSTVRQVAVRRVPAAFATVTTRVRRLSPAVFWVAAGASVPLTDAPAASHRSILLELVSDTLRLPPALTAGGDIRLGSGTVLAASGDCGSAGDSLAPALLASPSALVTRDGQPTTEGARDPAAGAAQTYAMPAGLRLAAMLDAASVRLAGGATITPGPWETGGECVRATDNWGGTPPLACAGHAPVIIGEGDLLVRGGVGQGALVVHGRLVLEGPFHYRGLIVATGGIETTGGPVTIEGAVFTGADGDATLHEGTVLTTSACSLAAAAEATARISVVPMRGWWR